MGVVDIVTVPRTAMSSPNQLAYSRESAWQPIQETSPQQKTVARWSGRKPSRSASRVPMTDARSMCSMGRPRPTVPFWRAAVTGRDVRYGRD